MPKGRPKKTTIKAVEPQAVEEKQPEIVQATPDTPAKAEYRALIEKYKEKNPVKCEQKKAEFERRLKGKIVMKYNPQSKTRTFEFFNLPPKE